MTPLEVYTSPLPIVFTHDFLVARYWICVPCITTVAPSMFSAYNATAVTEKCLDLMGTPALGRHCDKCHAPLFQPLSTTE